MPIDDRKFNAYKAGVEEQISALSRQLQQIRIAIDSESIVDTVLSEIQLSAMNANKLQNIPINISNLANRSILVYNNKKRQFECELYRTPKSIEQIIIHAPVVTGEGADTITLSVTTTGPIESDLLIGGTSVYEVPENKMLGFTVYIVGKQIGGNADSCYGKIEGAVCRSGSDTFLVGTPTITMVARTNQVPWIIRVVADDGRDCLVIKATGETGKTINWSAILNTVSVSL